MSKQDIKKVVCVFCDMDSTDEKSKDTAFVQRDDVAICSECICHCIKSIAVNRIAKVRDEKHGLDR